MTKIIIRQFCNLQCQIVFRRINMISFSIIIHKQSHITGHLSSFQISFHKHSLFNCIIPFRSPPFFIFWKIPFDPFLFLRHIQWIDTRIYTSRTNKTIRSSWWVTDSDGSTGRSIPPAFQFQMKPHYEFSGLLIINNFRAFHDAPFFNITSFCFRYG